jgi:hypothetical protein
MQISLVLHLTLVPGRYLPMLLPQLLFGEPLVASPPLCVWSVFFSFAELIGRDWLYPVFPAASTAAKGTQPLYTSSQGLYFSMSSPVIPEGTV